MLARVTPWIVAFGLLVNGCADDREPNLIIVSLDTLRQDHLPTYGYDRDTAPVLDKLARGAFVFDNAFAQDTNTNPSHTSMFTGVYPNVHGNQSNGKILAAVGTAPGKLQHVHRLLGTVQMCCQVLGETRPIHLLVGANGRRKIYSVQIWRHIDCEDR